MNVTLDNKIVFSLYLFKVYKSKYLEENKDRVMTQDELNDSLEKLKLLYLFNVDPEEKNEEDYIKFIKKFGTKVNVSGYGFNLDRIADIINALNVSGTKVYSKNLMIIDNKVNKKMKMISVFDTISCKRFKINVNENNKEVIVKKDFISYGINMLCMDEVEGIELDNEFLIGKLNTIMNKNGGYITSLKTLYLFKECVGKNFIRKWNEENMFISVVINSGYNFDNDCCYFDEYGDWDVYEDKDDPEGDNNW